MVVSRRWKRVSPGELRVERRGHDIALPHGHNATVFEPRQHVDRVTDPLDERGPDEHGVHGRVAQHGHLDVGLERIELPAEGVALDGHVEQREDRLVAVDDILRQQDHARTGAQDGRAAGRPGRGWARAGPSGR